jgi:hypothetical protein
MTNCETWTESRQSGLGGGGVIVPLLTLVFGVDLRQAIGASLVSVIATSSGAAAAYVKEGYSNIRIGMVLEIAAPLGALGGGALATHLPARAIAVVFGCLISLDELRRLPPRLSLDRDGHIRTALRPGQCVQDRSVTASSFGRAGGDCAPLCRLPLLEATLSDIRTRVAPCRRDRFFAPDIEATTDWASRASLATSVQVLLPGFARSWELPRDPSDVEGNDHPRPAA